MSDFQIVVNGKTVARGWRARLIVVGVLAVIYAVPALLFGAVFAGC
jgi:hypothetical protein